MTIPIPTIVVFLNPFELGSFDETLPAGEYLIESELMPVGAGRGGESFASSVLVHLHPQIAHPGLARTLTVSLGELEQAMANDRMGETELRDNFLEKMLADPLIRMVMLADGVSERDLRQYYATRSPGSGIHRHRARADRPAAASGGSKPDVFPRSGSSRPGIGE
ncbi:hypothetical protein PVT71_28845 (plasmid) [Salipiger sp. H15]|uniref:Uncharacterized protein n=1 Tax=Alloyangia sp. H15 TaxID=3029062 RepID=A0AAU8AS40_9RHOB